MSLESPAISVSLNGADNVGKTTQLRWLERAIAEAHLVGSIDQWHAGWRDVAVGDFARWWFESSSTAEHVELIMRSHVARRRASGLLALEDRGLPMLRATCAATAVIKDRLSAEQALDTVDRLAATLPAPPQRSEIHVLLRRSPDPGLEAAHALRREPEPPSMRYAAYQHVLAEILHLQADRGDYGAVLTIGDQPILDVQRAVRARLAELDIPVDGLLAYSPERVWVLAGLSESGKSTVGALMRDEHGVTRLKIGYLLDVAAARARVADPYSAWSETVQAERLTEELLRFGAATKAATISLESAHRFHATVHLKKVLGARCHVVFIDVDEDVRATRTAETPANLRLRDATKIERGADRIAEVADHTVDNSGPLSALKFAVSRLVSSVDLPFVEPDPVRPVSCGHWLRQATQYLVDDQVALLLATGSTGTGHWRPGWSDLDLLVVRDHLPAWWLRDVVGGLAAPDGTKLGVSAFTTGDIAALRVPPRVIQALRRAANGAGVLHRRAGYAVLVPSLEDGDRTSRGELGLVLMTTRRLLVSRNTDIRALHKHLVLIAKILLRADGHYTDAAEDIVAAFRDLYPAAGIDPPNLNDLITRRASPEAGDRLVDAVDRLLQYCDQLDQLTGNQP